MKNWINFEAVRDFAAEQTEAYRICSQPNGWVERYGDDLLVSYKHEGVRDEILGELDEWALGTQQTFRRVFGRYLPKQNAERHPPKLISGEAGAALRMTVQERGVSYGLDFGAGYSCGLFLDQRENRSFVRRRRPRKLLNTFAYTCSFSVVAAQVGAETLSIDLSKKSLQRGRENFDLNDLPSEGHRFLADDVMTVLPRLARKDERYDMIILDPPTFSRSHTGKAWQVERDFETLLLAALEVANRDAAILLSTNCTRLTERSLEVMGRFCLKANRRAATFQSAPHLPDFPSGVAARSLWMILR